MGPVQGAVEQVHEFRVDALGVDLNATQQFAPPRARCSASLLKVEVWDLALCVRTRLLGRDQGDANSCQDRCRSFGARGEGEERTHLRNKTYINLVSIAVPFYISLSTHRRTPADSTRCFLQESCYSKCHVRWVRPETEGQTC